MAPERTFARDCRKRESSREKCLWDREKAVSTPNGDLSLERTTLIPLLTPVAVTGRLGEKRDSELTSLTMTVWFEVTA